MTKVKQVNDVNVVARAHGEVVGLNVNYEQAPGVDILYPVELESSTRGI